jgi:hypothetical protein
MPDRTLVHELGSSQANDRRLAETYNEQRPLDFTRRADAHLIRKTDDSAGPYNGLVILGPSAVEIVGRR